MNGPMMGFDFAKLKGADLKDALSAVNVKLAGANAVLVATVDSNTGNLTNLEMMTTQQLAARQSLQLLS